MRKKPSQPIRFQRYVELMDCKAGRLLDLGCGDGAFASFLGDGYDYHGVEILHEKVDAAKRRGLDVTRHDLNHPLPFPSGTFDVVVAGEVIEHMPNPSNFLAEINRVLKDDGIFVGSTPNAANPTYYLHDVIINPMRGRGKMGGSPLLGLFDNKCEFYIGHYYTFSLAHLEALLELNGMRITKFTGTTLLPVTKLTQRLNEWLGKRLARLSTCIVFRAEKSLGETNNSNGVRG